MIDITDEPGVRTLWLAHSPSNALTPAMLTDLTAALAAARQDSGACVVVLASRIPKYFSSGLDVDEIFKRPAGSRIEVFLQLLETHRALAAYPGPTLAALGGYAMLGGWILAMACDYRWMAAETGRFALSEIRFGLTPTEFLIRRLRAIGADGAMVKELVLRGRTFKAAAALAGRFVDRLLPAARLNEEALREARRLAKLPPAAYASVKRGFYASANAGSEAVWERSREEFRRLFAGEEAREGLNAMREKRRARWGGPA